MHFADVVFPIAPRAVYTYSIPPALHGLPGPGKRVFVPFQHTKKAGMVVAVHQQEPAFKTKDIESVIDSSPVLSDELIKTGFWMSRFYYCGPGESIDAMLPHGLQIESVLYMALTANGRQAEGGGWPEVQTALEAEPLLRLDRLIKKAGVTRHWVLRQVKEGKLERSFFPEQRRSAAVFERLEASPDFSEAGVIERITKRGAWPKWAMEARRLLESGLLPAGDDALRAAGFARDALNRMEELGLLIRRTFLPDFSVPPDAITRLNPLNPGQEVVIAPVSKAIHEGGYAAFLLKGVTGSGKTEVYLHAMAQTLAKGRGALLLIPEIALTPQTVRRFQRVFGDGIAVLHSRLTDRERMEEWEHLQSGRKRIAIGARSAVFAPVENLGLIILDEEHDASFKQAEPAPRYHAREVALVRAKALQAVVIAGSATPSLATLESARSGKITLLELSGRHGTARLPGVHLINLHEYRAGMHGPLAAPLFLAAEEALGVGDQVILLLNRRGYAPFLQCDVCGKTPGCPHCSVTLTWHKAAGQLRCHYCGYARTDANPCSDCGHPDLKPQGQGTQQLEEDVLKLFPGVAALRFDMDTLGARDAHAELLGRFARKEAQLMVGTQVVAKGHDFPDVTVVGVINADTELAFPNYRSNERMFAMLSQVAGRAGRARKPGNVFIQTRMPTHPVLQFAAAHDFDGFANEELEQRRMLLYPPFSRLIKLVLKDPDAQKPRLAGERLVSLAAVMAPGVPVLGPTAALPYKRADAYYWEVLIKLPASAGPNQLEHYMDLLLDAYRTGLPQPLVSVAVVTVVDPME